MTSHKVLQNQVDELTQAVLRLQQAVLETIHLVNVALTVAADQKVQIADLQRRHRPIDFANPN